MPAAVAPFACEIIATFIRMVASALDGAGLARAAAARPRSTSRSMSAPRTLPKMTMK